MFFLFPVDLTENIFKSKTGELFIIIKRSSYLIYSKNNRDHIYFIHWKKRSKYTVDRQNKHQN